MELVLYYREECHLCDAMRKAMVVFSRNHVLIQWREVDIDRELDLIRQFDSLVPVLCHGDKAICYHFFDQEALLLQLDQ